MQKKQADIRGRDTSLIGYSIRQARRRGDGVATGGAVFLDGHGGGKEQPADGGCCGSPRSSSGPMPVVAAITSLSETKGLGLRPRPIPKFKNVRM